MSLLSFSNSAYYAIYYTASFYLSKSTSSPTHTPEYNKCVPHLLMDIYCGCAQVHIHVSFHSVLLNFCNFLCLVSDHGDQWSEL